MRIAIAGLLVVVPLLAGPAQAQNSVLDQAQQLLGNNRNSDAYQRGREDEMRRQDAERRRRHDERTAERNNNGPPPSDYRQPDYHYGYHN